MASSSFRGLSHVDNDEDQPAAVDHPEDTPAGFSSDAEPLRRSKRKKGNDIAPPELIPSGSTSAGNTGSMPLSAPTSMSDLLRPSSKISFDPEGPPFDPEYITILHPGNGLVMFTMYAYDRLPSLEPLEFGVHRETLLAACQIVANNKSGYLSKCGERDPSKDDVALDPVLLPGDYFYHLDVHDEELYHICHDFHNWTFPHENMPLSWCAPPPLPDTETWSSAWSVCSLKIKARDKICLVSGSKEYLSTSHLVPKDQETWSKRNRMRLYLGGTSPCNQSPRNLFALRFDFHLGGFDLGQFVIVPKSGKLVVHFIGHSPEVANGYHNTIFNHNNNLSHEALYARFAWAVLKRVVQMKPDPKEFKFVDIQGPKPDTSSEGGGGGRDSKGTRKRKRKDEDRGEEEDEDDDDNGDTSGDFQPGGQPQHRQLDSMLQGPNAWLSDVLMKIAPDNSQSSLEDDAREIEEDLKFAHHYQPFLVDPKIEPTASDYETIGWYPGIDVVERRKRRYLDSHPNISAYGNTLQSNSVVYDSD